MTDLKGQHLNVNLSASQVRRRLRGLGLGVRKVQCAGRNKAVVIHTATGAHRRELYAILEDVIATADADE